MNSGCSWAKRGTPLKRQFPGFALRPVGTSDLLEHLGHKVVPRPNANAAAWQWSGTDSMMLQVVAAKSAVPGACAAAGEIEDWSAIRYPGHQKHSS